MQPRNIPRVSGHHTTVKKTMKSKLTSYGAKMCEHFSKFVCKKKKEEEEEGEEEEQWRPYFPIAALVFCSRPLEQRLCR